MRQVPALDAGHSDTSKRMVLRPQNELLHCRRDTRQLLNLL